MGRRPASSKATRGASKGKKPLSSGSSNPKANKFRSQYNSLAVIAKGGPSKKAQNKDAIKKVAKEAADRKKFLDGFENMNVLTTFEENETRDVERPKNKKRNNQHDSDAVSGGSKLTTASFASVWSNCTNSSLNAFFQVWNPNLETHKDALAVIAGLSQIMSNKGTEQSDLEYSKTLFWILSSPNTPTNVLTGALLALTFVIRKLPDDVILENFDTFYPVLKNLMEKYHNVKKKSIVKCLVRCFVSLTKAHPDGKKSIADSSLRKKINLAIRQYKVQDKLRL